MHSNVTAPIEQEKSRMIKYLLIGLAFVAWPLAGCQQTTNQAFLRCQQPKGSPCMGQRWFTGTHPVEPASAWTSKPRFWRYQQAGKTVGVMLLGHPKDQMLGGLGHAIHASLHEFSTPTGFLTTGAMYAMYGAGADIKTRAGALLASWDSTVNYLEKAKRIVVRNASAVSAHNALAALQTNIADFHQSSQLRKVLFVHRNPQDGPLVIPYYTIQSPPQPYLLRLPKSVLPKNRATVLGNLYLRLHLRSAIPLIQQLNSEYYVHNKKLEESMFPGRMQCHYKWYRLFQTGAKTIAVRNFQVHLEQVEAGQPTRKFRIFCNAQRLDKFRKTPQIIRQLSRHRKELVALNRAFRQYSAHYLAAQKQLATEPLLSTSVAIDGILRQHTLHYPQQVEINGKMVDPATLFEAWQQEYFQKAWRAIHKQAQDSGQYLDTTKAQPAGIFDKSYTVYRSEELGENYQIAPHAIIEGSFAVILDRRRGVIDIITNHKPYPFVGRRSLQTKNRTTTPKRLSLRQKVERACQDKLTMIHAATAKDIPALAPNLPPRSFLLKENFLWLRLESTITVIPIAGANALKPDLQRKLVQQIESAMAQRDAIPQHVRVLTITNDTPNLQISFPGDKP